MSSEGQCQARKRIVAGVLVQFMYKDERSRERVCDWFSEEFNVGLAFLRHCVRGSVQGVPSSLSLVTGVRR